jgi:hypothetical protein
MAEVGGEDADDERYVEPRQGGRGPSMPEAPTPSTSAMGSGGERSPFKESGVTKDAAVLLACNR